MTRCQAIKRTGERCKADAMPGVEWCYSHDPSEARAEERRRNASRGGRTGGRGRRAPGSIELERLKTRISNLADAVLAGNVDPKVGAVVVQALNSYRATLESQKKLFELEDLEERLSVLEQSREGGEKYGA